MTRVTIRDVGRIGVLSDLAPFETPPEAWTLADNIAFIDGFACRSLGESQVEGTPTGNPHYIFPSANETNAFWCYTDLDNFWAVAGGTHTEITRASGIYTGDIDDKWNGGWLGGIMILNNGIDDPQEWDLISAGTLLAVLGNWPADTKCRVMRVFQNFLIALDVTKSSTRYPTMFKWSHPADPRTVPSSWDETDATVLAGELSLSDTPGFLIDGVPLGKSLMLYKTDSIIRMDRIATNSVFHPNPLSSRTGLMGINCAQEFKPRQHVFLTIDADVAITDGINVTRISDEKVRKRLQANIDGANRGRSFVVTDPKTNQAYICYPTTGNTYCNEAAVWNWKLNTWGFRTLTPTLDIKAGIYDESALAENWDADSQVWDLDTTTWNEAAFVASGYKMLGAYPVADEIREFGVSQKRGSDTYTSTLERTGLAIYGQDRQGNPKVDPNKIKQVTEIWPLIRTNGISMNMQVSVGSQDTPEGAITWDGPYDFDPLTDEKIDCFAEGAYIGVRFVSSAEVPWKMSGYGLNINVVGEAYVG